MTTPAVASPTPHASYRSLSSVMLVEEGRTKTLSDETVSQSDEPLSAMETLAIPLSLLREIAFLVVVCAGQLLTQASLAQGIAPAHIINDSLGGTGTAAEISWYSASYSLTTGTFILVAGRLGDAFGHKRLVMAGFVWFALWSVLAGCSQYTHSSVFFNICRALQGIGPAVVLPNGQALLGHFYPPGKRKDMAFALFGAVAPIGFLLGALFSSLFAEKATWSWSFFCLGFVCCLLVALAAFAIPSQLTEADHEVKHQFDYWGSLLGVAGLVLCNIAWNQAPSEGWGESYVICLFVLGLLALVGFVFVERRALEPLVPLDCLKTETVFVLATVGAGWASFGVWLLYLWQFLEGLRGLSPLHATAQVVSLGLVGLVAGVTTGFLLSRVPTSRILLVSVICFGTGNALLCTTPVDQTYWAQTFLSTLIMPWAMDMSFPAGTVMVSNAMPKKHQGLGASLVNTVVNYSISIGLGVAGTAEYYTLQHGSDTLHGYRSAWYVGVGFAVLGISIALLAIRREIRRQS